MSTSVPAPQRCVVVGTAGHIDHGKTTLVRALTGVDTDRLPEEKRRGISVDLGFARCDLKSPSGSLLSLDIVDVPGHKQFVRNMLAGAGGIDIVMLVISAAEGVMPQTEEHLAICQLLGIRRGLIALTKADLVSEEQLGVACAEIRATLRSSFLKDAPIVPVSAASGIGLQALRTCLTQLAEHTPVRGREGVLRLPIDRAFVIKGFGTVVTGTLQAGSLKAGQSLIAEPGGKPVRVRGLQRQGRSCNDASAGSRVALNLSGIEVGELRRGDVLVAPSTLHAVDAIDAEIQLLPGAPELPHRARVRFHSFAAETVATVSIYGYHAIPAGATQLVRIKLANPVVLVPGDRFVLRRLSPAQTIGGGRVIDSHPLAGIPRKKAFAWLEQIKDASATEHINQRVIRREAAGLELPQLTHEVGWTANAVQEALRPMLQSGAIRLLAEKLLVSATALALAGEQVVQMLPVALPTGPAKGMRLSELRSQSHLGPEVFSAAVAMLADKKRIIVRGESGREIVYPPGVNLNTPDPNAARIAALADLYQGAGLNPPLFADILRRLRLSEKDARACVTLLLREGTLIKIGPDDVLMHRAPIEGLEKTIRGLKGQTMDVARLKQITGLSRKYAIPLFEYLDRQRITRRQGDSRIVL